ncbi:oxidoreductase, short-chain dehydrogenase/reductase family [Aspergillus undulatus]|uniref:oxidoreductase, short-chain dehydrogenase/reductase family n=1 Tax=Aspergillus undulatus TaxID=1810928 RepID=UPI003CCD31B4
MSFPYKHCLAVGATSGIGLALATQLVQTGVKVTVVGRRQERLDQFVQTHGPDKADGVAFDITRLDDIPAFARSVMTKSPDIDCIFFNAGVQKPYDVAEQFDLASFHNEVKVNFTSFVDLTHALLPYLKKNPDPTAFIFTGSNISIVPAATLPAYSASKVALNAFTLCLREQLRHSNTRVIEISPPPVQTELHDYMGEDAGRQLGMPLDAFIKQVYDGLLEGKDQIVIGSIGPADTFNEIVDKRRTAFHNLAKIMRAGKD